MHRFDQDRLASNDARETRRSAGFLRSEDGSFIIFGLFIFLLMLIVAGMSVDFMRFETQRTRLQSTLDRAILAAASMEQTLDPEEVVLDYFNKAGLGEFIDASMIDVYENERLIDENYSGPSDESLTSRRVEASANMTIGTTFLKFSGIDGLGAPAGGAAEESASQTEISLVLDTSGSMSWGSDSGNSKIYELRRAAKKFINIVLCDPAYPNRTSPCVVEDGKVSVTIVPYSEQVLVGEALLGYFNPTDEHDYSSCVTFSESDFDSTAITPTQVLQREGHIDPWSDDYDAGGDNNRTCQTDDWREITAVSGNASTLRDAVGDLGAAGNTSIDVAMKWGTAFLDPAAQPIVDDLIAADKTDEDYEGRPLDYDIGRAAKVIVLMTDGVNTNQHYLYDGFHDGASPLYFSDHDDSDDVEDSIRNPKGTADPEDDEYYWLFASSYESYPMDRPYGEGLVPVCINNYNFVRPWRWDNPSKCTWEEGPGATAMDYADLWEEYSWEWWEDWDFLPSQGSRHRNSEKNDRLDDICTAAKDEDITVFTIGFEVTTSSATVMRNCASSPAHYYNADGLDLASAFAAIAREISKLRLTN